jgi:hypothetical protein
MNHVAELQWFRSRKGCTKRSTAGGVPSKATLIGSWRDLDRAEALLELIDNSIDADFLLLRNKMRFFIFFSSPLMKRTWLVR